MSKGPFQKWIDDDGNLDPALWDRMDRSFRASVLYNEITGKGVDVFEHRVPSNVERLWRVQKPSLNGISTPVLTLMGKERTLNRSTQGKRAWGDAKRLVAYYGRDIKTLPAMHATWQGAEKKMDTHRGILDAQGYAAKVAAYAVGSKPDVDQKVIDTMEDLCVEVFNELQAVFGDLPVVEFDDVDTWISQFKPNKNSAWPYHMPISKERFLTQDLPNFRPSIQKILDAREIDEALWNLEVSSVKNANYKIYSAFYRSTDRLIHASRLFIKSFGAWINYMVTMMKGNVDISWDSIDKLQLKIAAAMSKSYSTVHDDLMGYDTTFGEEAMTALFNALVRSDFMKNHPKMRNALLFLFYESKQHGVILQLTPMHAMYMRPSLWSGTPITQLLGSIWHLAMYKYMEEELSIGIMDRNVLSDDGMLCVDNSASEMQKLLFGPWSEIVKGMGMQVHPDKSYVADLENRIPIGVYKGDPVEYADAGPYLQFFFQPNSALTYGVAPRRMWSLFEMERDSSQEGIRAMLKTHSTALTDVRSGNEIPESYFDLYRSISVLTTVRPGFAGIDDTLAWYRDSWPNFDRRYSKLNESVNRSLWDEHIPIAGGTLDSGLSPRWVTDYYNEWMDAGVQPKLWD